ncbi:MAG: hypothetical protein CL666_04680 [Balneola sp.]|nr:hypothetical protein [Balneola sp.]|tara:strand:+ start:43621 stop:43974 length:354 start_codon:yes stop_codon:yes gene_type:complete
MKATQSEATLHLLMVRANQWVPMPEIVNYTAQHCRSMCHAIHSRASDLRERGYDIQNETKEVDGVKHSCYKLSIAPGALNALKAKFTLGESIPHYNQLKEYKPKGVQKSMFPEACVV